MPTFENTDSVKERVLQNIKSTLEGITVANGFGVNIAQVLRYRIAGYDVQEYPTLLVVGPKENKERRTGGYDKTDVTLYCDIEVLATNDSMEDSEEYHDLIMRDIEAALLQDETRGGIARDTDVLSTSFQAVNAQLPYALSIVSVKVTYAHLAKDPTAAR
jgi:hypothetical protein